MKKNTLLIITLLIASTQIFATSKIVYGTDNREDIYQVNDPMFINLAISTAAMIPNYSLKQNKYGDYVAEGNTLQKRMNVCSTERFAQQLSIGICSGFLIAPDLVVTAGHCMTKPDYCKNFKWVFDFALLGPNFENRTSMDIPSANVYSCKRIEEQKLTRSWAGNLDYAVIRLDRPVIGRRPLEFRTSGSVSKGDPLVIIGHPSGIPSKVSADAVVRSNNKTNYFVTNLDSFGGNSGSAVFNSNTGLVEGILVRGATDYVKKDGCRVVNVCSSTGCRGESVTRITKVKYIQ